MKVVLDANGVAGALGWQGENYLLFINLARRRLFACGTEAALRESRQAALRIIERFRLKHNEGFDSPCEPMTMGRWQDL